MSTLVLVGAVSAAIGAVTITAAVESGPTPHRESGRGDGSEKPNEEGDRLDDDALNDDGTGLACYRSSPELVAFVPVDDHQQPVPENGVRRILKRVDTVVWIRDTEAVLRRLFSPVEGITGGSIESVVRHGRVIYRGSVGIGDR